MAYRKGLYNLTSMGYALLKAKLATEQDIPPQQVIDREPVPVVPMDMPKVPFEPAATGVVMESNYTPPAVLVKHYDNTHLNRVLKKAGDRWLKKRSWLAKALNMKEN